MRALPARRLAASALCATLLTGLCAPAALAAADSPQERRERSPRHAPLPGADALVAQAKSLGDAGGVLAAVTPLLDAALKADKGQLPKDQVTKLADAAKDAIKKTSAAAPATPATPAGAKSGDDVRSFFADVKADSLAALQKAVDGLAAASTSGDATKVAPAATAVITSEVNVLAATLLGSKLPAPDLPGLPKLPSLPAAVPAAPAVPAVPAAPSGQTAPDLPTG